MFDYTIPENVPLDINDEAALDKLQSKIERNWNKREGKEDVQLALDAFCRHAVKHKDCSKLTRLRNSMPRHAPIKLVMDWIDAFTSFKWIKDKAGNYKYLGRDEENATYYAFDLKGRDVPFWDFEKPKVEKAYVFKDKLDALLKVAFSKIKAGKIDADTTAFIKYMDDAAKAYVSKTVKPKTEKPKTVKPKTEKPELVEPAPLALAA